VSTGEYITTQDSDDWSHPERIERQVWLLENNPQAVACHCGGIRMQGDGRFEVHRPGRLFWGICYPSIMYQKKAMMESTGYWDCVRVEADSEYLRRVVRLWGKHSVLACPKPLMIQLRREGSLTTLPETKNVGGVILGSRLAYRTQSTEFLKSMRAGNARYDFERWLRPFPAPESISVPDELVREAASWNCDAAQAQAREGTIVSERRLTR
jgi:hypothetical protein